MNQKAHITIDPEQRGNMSVSCYNNMMFFNKGINIEMSPQRRQAKQARHRANREYRAQLHSQKAACSSPQARAVIQEQIDQISLRGKMTPKQLERARALEKAQSQKKRK